MQVKRKEIIKYESCSVLELSEHEIKACSDLFSTSYGKYEVFSPFRPGGQILMGVGQYKSKRVIIRWVDFAI